jgi:hypothetical protein
MRPLLLFALLAASIIAGYVWYRSGVSDLARGDLRLSVPGQPHLIPWPEPHWRYGPETDATALPHLDSSPRR